MICGCNLSGADSSPQGFRLGNLILLAANDVWRTIGESRAVTTPSVSQKSAANAYSQGKVRFTFRWVFLFLAQVLSVMVSFGVLAEDSSSHALSAGTVIYRNGLLPSGQLLTGQRETDGAISGVQAACVNCHRRSGLGGKEGGILIPPIAGPYLFQTAARDADGAGLPYVESMRPRRTSYNDATLARAIRDGIGVDGRPLSFVMPRYKLTDADMTVLISYLKNLGRAPVPGVSETTLHFATIITPDADPTQRAGMLSVLNEFFRDKNAFFRGQSPRLKSSRKMMFRVNRMWQLHVWELSGSPSTWEQQLHEHMRAEPVFAVISGLAGSNWEPVQKFCDDEAVPCLFPNVDHPVDGSGNVYSTYFSQGVSLEAALIAHDISKRVPDLASHRLIQVFRSGDVGEAAANTLANKMKATGIPLQNQSLPATRANDDVVEAINLAKPGDVLVLWLRPEDVEALGSVTQAETIYASSVMGGADKPPLSPSWLAKTRLAYPFDLPSRRRVPVDYALGWFTIRKIPVVALRTQADTFLACSILAETLGHMVDAFVRDYLIERMEDMLGRRVITGYYRHLSLGPGQRIASKGGYIMRFANEHAVQLVADSDWIVPE